MKQLFTLLLLMISFSAVSQVKTSSPTGKRLSDPNQIVLSSTTETTLIADSIQANNLVLGKYYPFRIELAITTGLLNASTLTIKIKYGSGTVTVMNGITLSSSLTDAPITISGYIVARGTNAQFVPVVVSQSGASALSLTPTNSSVRGTMAVDATVKQAFSITATLGGVIGSTILKKDWGIIFDF